MRHATIQIHLLRHDTIQKHILRHATIQKHILRHDTIQIHQMRHATIHIVYYSNSPNEACHYSNTSNEACHCAHCHHQVTVVTGQGCKTYVLRRRSIRGWFTRVFDLHHHLVYRGALSHIQWNVVFTFQRDYNHTVCECLVLINVCECLVLINTQIYTNEV
jgi:hypothetical protein